MLDPAAERNGDSAAPAIAPGTPPTIAPNLAPPIIVPMNGACSAMPAGICEIASLAAGRKPSDL